MSKRDEIVAIALSQKGYTEGTNNDTKYGEWYGLNYNHGAQCLLVGAHTK